MGVDWLLHICICDILNAEQERRRLGATRLKQVQLTALYKDFDNLLASATEDEIRERNLEIDQRLRENRDCRLRARYELDEHPERAELIAGWTLDKSVLEVLKNRFESPSKRRGAQTNSVDIPTHSPRSKRNRGESSANEIEAKLNVGDRVGAVKIWQSHRTESGKPSSKASLYKEARQNKSEYYRWEGKKLPVGCAADKAIRRVLKASE